MLVKTPIGNLIFRASLDGRPLDINACSWRIGELRPDLPKGMSVARSIAVLFLAHPGESLRNLQLSGAWEDEPPGKGGAASGQSLDAQEWEADGWTVVLGTEDYDALATRLPDCGFREDDYPVSYKPSGLTITVPAIPLDTATTLHFIVAINAFPEPVECSAWFAADVPHQQVLEALGGN